MEKIIINPKKNITIEDVWKVARYKAKVGLSEEAKEKVNKSRKFIEEVIAMGDIVYGVNTGFGQLKNKLISKDQTKQLQINLIRSHAVGVGEPFNETEVRAIMFVRLVSLSRGHSGVRLVVLEKLLELLNKNIIPHIPRQGSVGCSGDLAPLSHMSLVLIGEGKIVRDGKILPAKNVLKKFKIKPVCLKEKEGLALNNGTAAMTAIAAINVIRALNLVKNADIIGAISLETLMGTLTPFDEKIQKVRPHKGQAVVAINFGKLCEASELMKSHKKCERIQDSYVLRCIPQVHGAVRDAVEHCKKEVEIELNSVTDNPLVFPEEKEIKSGGSFHGEPIALSMDFLAIALSDLGNISERRTFKMLTPQLNDGLPPFLIGSENLGLNSGLMIAQYTAASLVAENKVYAHPVSVDSIPTSAEQEDHVSFGTIASNKCVKVIDNLEYILAIELLCAVQAAEFRKPLLMGIGNQIVYDKTRKKIKKIVEDREFHIDINKAKGLVNIGELVEELSKMGILVL